jgi:mannose-1-phosphate guanylyltransferase
VLGETIAIASRMVSPERVVVVVDSEHRSLWGHELARLPRHNVVVQPCDRGTGPALALALLSILERDTIAHVAVLPADHCVAAADVLVAAVRRAFANSRRLPGPLELLGFAPDGEPHSDQSWIMAGRCDGETRSVQRFVAEPGAEFAAELGARGAFWSPCLLVARAISIVGLFQLRLPDLLAPLLQRMPNADAAAAAAIYDRLQPTDLARELLADSEPCLRLRVVPPCGLAASGRAALRSAERRTRHSGAV